MLHQNTNFSSIVQQWHHLHQQVEVPVHCRNRRLTMKTIHHRRQKTHHQDLQKTIPQSLMMMRVGQVTGLAQLIVIA